MRKPIKIPSIEAPRFNDLPSMQTSILQLKEAVELLSGQRGGGFFPTYEDATRVQEQIKDLQKDSKWDVLYNQDFSGVTSFNITNLQEYRNLRGQLHIYQLTGAAQWPYARVIDSAGAVVTTAIYFAEGMYNVESVNPQNVAGWTNVVLNRTVIPLSFENVMSVGHIFGANHNFCITNFNKALYGHFMSQLSYYNGANIVKGTMVCRESTPAPRSGLVFGIVGPATCAGHLYLEGLKG